MESGGSPDPANPPVYGPSPPPGGNPNVVGEVTVQDDGSKVIPIDGSEKTSKEVMSPSKAEGTTSLDELKELILAQNQVIKSQGEQISKCTEALAQKSKSELREREGETFTGQPFEKTEYHSMSDNISVAASAEQYVDAINDNSNAMKKLQESIDKKEELDKIHKSDVKLSTLVIGTPGTRAILLENWLRDSKGKVSSMSDYAIAFWTEMIQKVEDAYNKWSQADPMERSEIEVESVSDKKYSRIKPLVGNVMRDAQQNKVKDFLLSMNLVEPEEVLFAENSVRFLGWLPASESIGKSKYSKTHYDLHETQCHS